jgi:broad specificity polyphosphatase/5'/3'-nucleotidase SurE
MPASAAERERQMAGMIRRNAPTVIVSGAVAAATAAVLAGAPALARSTITRVTPTPVIISGSKSLAILTSAATVTVARLPLPAGSWAIFAKADTSTQGGTAVEFHCTLIAGNSVDHTDPELEQGGSSAFTENIALNVAHRFSGPGSASLVCNSSGFTVDVSSIKITAIKAGTMTIVGLH